MISWYDDFVPMRQFTEPSIEIDNCIHTLGEHGEVASVDEDVAIRHLDLAMKLMRVAEEDKAQGGSLCGRSTRLFHTLISGAGRVLGKIPRIFFFCWRSNWWVVRQGKGSGIRLVHKAYGGGPAKSLKTETTNTSYWLVYKVKVMDR
jgi:hypothetical protein